MGVNMGFRGTGGMAVVTSVTSSKVGIRDPGPGVSRLALLKFWGMD